MSCTGPAPFPWSLLLSSHFICLNYYQLVNETALNIFKLKVDLKICYDLMVVHFAAFDCAGII